MQMHNVASVPAVAAVSQRRLKRAMENVDAMTCCAIGGQMKRRLVA